jgi:hypothetical protein
VRRGVIFRLNPKTLGLRLKSRCNLFPLFFRLLDFDGHFVPFIVSFAEYFFLRRILDVRARRVIFFV